MGGAAFEVRGDERSESIPEALLLGRPLDRIVRPWFHHFDDGFELKRLRSSE